MLVYRHAYVVYLCLVCIMWQFSMLTCSLLMLVEEEAYSRAALITALYVAMSVSFCLPHPVAVSVFIICSGLCACTEML